MAILTDKLFHNQVREGTHLIVKDDFTVMTSKGLVNLNKGWRVNVTDVINRGTKVLVRVQGDFIMGTTIDSILEIFDRVVEGSEAESNVWAKPLH